jgi:hypothetical protein
MFHRHLRKVESHRAPDDAEMDWKPIEEVAKMTELKWKGMQSLLRRTF